MLIREGYHRVGPVLRETAFVLDGAGRIIEQADLLLGTWPLRRGTPGPDGL